MRIFARILAPAAALLLSASLAPSATSTTSTTATPTEQRAEQRAARDTIGVVSANAYQDLNATQAKADAHRLIKNLDVDIIGWQEAQNNLNVYRNQLPKGWRTATFRKNGKLVAREVPISWDNRVYALVKGSNNAKKAHHGMGKGKTKYPFPARWTTRVVLRHRKSDKTIAVLNVHANQKIQRRDRGHCGEAMKTDNARLARRHFADVKEISARQRATYTVVTGDFNVDYTCDRRVKPAGFPAARFPGTLVPSFRVLGTTPRGTKDGRHIDYVYLATRDSGVDAKFVSQRIFANLKSDHNAYLARIRLR